jgi:nucleosome assembly protein 1-like 1
MANSSIKNKLLYIQKVNEERMKYQEDTYDKEYMNLKIQFDEQYAKLNSEVSDIIGGTVVPQLSLEELKKYGIDNTGSVLEEGIPNYWATVLLNSKSFFDVNEKDELILTSLKNIRIVYKEDKLSFNVEFVFAPNDYFTNEVLTKTYSYNGKDHSLYKIEGCTVNWKSADKIPNKIVKTKKVKSKIII